VLKYPALPPSINRHVVREMAELVVVVDSATERLNDQELSAKVPEVDGQVPSVSSV